jgi:hypothetical protein
MLRREQMSVGRIFTDFATDAGKEVVEYEQKNQLLPLDEFVIILLIVRI